MASSLSNTSVGASPPHLTLEWPAAESLELRLAGTWRVGEAMPSVTRVSRELDEQRPQQLVFETSKLGAWDSALVWFAARIDAIARAAGVAVDRSGLPLGVQRLVALAEAGPRPSTAPPRVSLVARIGNYTLDARDRLIDAVRWIGEVTIAFVRMLFGRFKLRRGELLHQANDAGLRSLVPVILVVGVLGFVLAHVALHQLKKIGDTAAVARVVAVGIVRELGPLMAAIVVAVRSGAAYASDLDSMRRSHETDAFTALGMSPVETLVLPRILAVVLMLPLLCAFAIAAGLLGGAAVGIGTAHIPPAVYLAKTLEAVSQRVLAAAFLKSMMYGLVIGVTACHIGLNPRRLRGPTRNAAVYGSSQCVLFVVLTCGLMVVLK